MKRISTLLGFLVLSLQACGPYCEESRTVTYSGGTLGAGAADAVGAMGHSGTHAAVSEEPGKWEADGSCNGSLSFASGALPELLGVDSESWWKKHPDGKRSSEWKIRDLRDFATASVKLLMLESWAQADSFDETIGKELDFSQGELKALAGRSAAPIAAHIKQLKIVKGPGGSLFLELITMSGTRIVANSDSNWEHACNLIDKSLPTNQKLTYETVNVKTGTKKTVSHPFQGKACSKERIQAFHVFNFREGSAIGDRTLPAITVLFEKNKKRPQSWVFFNRGEREDKNFFDALQKEFSSALLATERLALRSGN